MGHVDHGKTKILDYIRKSKVAEGEAGGITQHIGAYQAEISEFKSLNVSSAKKITFLDTPGHEAFSAIRSRGAKVADIGILVVAADEGVKPQTKEAIKILQESETSFVVAINKIDKEGANPQKVKQELSENNVFIEEWGGKTPIVEVSAKTGQGIDGLLEMIILMAELEELSANPQSPASGVVIESHLDNKKGNLATLLVLDGTLYLNDWIIVGKTACKIKSMSDFTGKEVKEAEPSMPVVVLGWSITPALGQRFEAASSKEEAEKKSVQAAVLGKQEIFKFESGAEASAKKILNLIIRADSASSLEAMDQALFVIKSEEVGFRVLAYGAGNISDGDVKAAVPSGAMILGFHTGADSTAKSLAEREKIEIFNFDIIYEIVEKVREKMETMLEPEIRRNLLGKLKVLVIFKKEDKFQIIGGKVVSGKVKRGALAEIMRSNAPLIKGKIGQLQHNKADVEEVKEGLECGIRFDSYLRKASEGSALPIREGDLLEVYEEEIVKRSL